MEQEKNAVAEPIELSEMAPHAGTGQRLIGSNLEAIEHVKVRIAVQVGGTSITVAELNNLKDQHVIRLDSMIDEPVDVLLEGRVVARGQLVAVEDNFGVRITELPRSGI